jgi:hypothetical protein
MQKTVQTPLELDKAILLNCHFHTSTHRKRLSLHPAPRTAQEIPTLPCVIALTLSLYHAALRMKTLLSLVLRFRFVVDNDIHMLSLRDQVVSTFWAMRLTDRLRYVIHCDCLQHSETPRLAIEHALTYLSLPCSAASGSVTTYAALSFNRATTCSSSGGGLSNDTVGKSTKN